MREVLLRNVLTLLDGFPLVREVHYGLLGVAARGQEVVPLVLREGSAETLGIPPKLRRGVDVNPGNPVPPDFQAVRKICDYEDATR